MKRLTILLVSSVLLTVASQGCWQGDSYEGTAPPPSKAANENSEPEKQWDPVLQEFREVKKK